MFSPEEFQRVISGDDSDVDLDDLRQEKSSTVLDQTIYCEYLESNVIGFLFFQKAYPVLWWVS